MIETLLGGLLGGAFRLAPEILKWLDRKGERSHELAMQDKALEFEKLRGAQRMAEIGAAADAAWNTGAIDALREAVAAQGQRSGVRWADALSTSASIYMSSAQSLSGSRFHSRRCAFASSSSPSSAQSSSIGTMAS
jgi:hypothetical protein